MIPLPIEYETIEKNVREGSITGQQASDQIHAARTKLGPPWHWKSWKIARDTLIKQNCQTCGKGEEAILTLQHTFILPKLGDSVRGVKHSSDYYDALQEKAKEIKDSEAPVALKCCPKCESTAIVYRKRAANWICNGKKNKRSCSLVFLDPSETMGLSPAQKKDISIQKDQYRHDLFSQRKDEWLEAGILLWLDQMRRYLSLKDTKTLCKRCAFMEDMTSKKPCQTCGFGINKYEVHCPKCGNGTSYESNLPASV
jgi:Zn finger protein HypA/HybF involved in hydrogenase expression